MALSKSFDYLNFNEHLEAGFHGIRDEQAIKDIVAYVQKLKPDERPKSHKFSLTTKTILRQKFNIHNQNFCRICDGLLHSSSTEVDHRIAMSAAVAALAARGEVTIDDVACVATSFPNFFELLEQVALR